MKKLPLLFLAILLLDSTILTANELPPKQRQTRDSVMCLLKAMPLDSIRFQTAKNLFLQYIHEDWSLDLADLALRDARKLKNRKGEIDSRYNHYLYARYRHDTTQMRQTIAPLRKACYKYKDYDLYFDAWTGLLEVNADNGNYEQNFYEIEKMHREAERLNTPYGHIEAKISEGITNLFMNNTRQAAQYFHQALEYPKLTDKQLFTIHSLLADACMRLEKNAESLNHLDAMKQAMKRLMHEKPAQLNTMYNQQLELEHRYIRTYFNSGNLDSVKFHLLKADKYYHKATYSPHKLVHHELWAFYHYKRKEWDDCLREIDKAITLNQEIGAYNKAVMETTKAKFLHTAGRLDACLDQCERMVSMTDSVNRDLLARQADALHNNYRIEQALLQRNSYHIRMRLIWAGTGLLLALILAGAAVRTYIIRKKLKLTRQQTEIATRTAQEADKLKEAFLKNITDKINAPLTDIVRYARILSGDDKIPQEEMTGYSHAIQQSADQLMELINNILDLSRLEAGMMRFQIETTDVVQMCREAIQIVQHKTGNISPVEFESDTEHLPFSTDRTRFEQMLTSLFVGSSTNHITSIRCKLYTTPCEFSLRIDGSPLSAPSLKNESQNIANEINRLFTEAFHGTYILENSVITIRFPRQTSESSPKEESDNGTKDDSSLI